MSEPSNDLKAIFKAKVNERLALRPNQWAGDDSVAVVRAIVTSIQGADGKPIDLTKAEEDVIQIASKPTVETLVQVIRTIVEAHQGKFDKTAESLIRRSVSAAGFKLELTKAGIIKDTNAGGLKDLLG